MSTNTKQPKFVVLESETMDPMVQELLDRFDGMVVGQPAALEGARRALEAMTNPLRDKRRPIFKGANVGPSRTGKSLTPRVLAKLIHGDEDAITELEGADYEERHQSVALKGAPPSYVGFPDKKEREKLQPHEVDEYSIISNHNLKRVRLGSKSTVNIVIINEFEKAHPTFYKFWMGVFDKGYAQLGNGEIVDFTNTIFFLTMNLGMEEVERLEEGGIGFTSRAHKATKDEVKGIVDKAMRLTYKREFRNRLDGVFIFKPHTAEELFQIVGTELKKVEVRIFEQIPRGEAFELEVEDSARKFLLDVAMADGGTVAELARVIDQHLVNKLGRELGKKTIGMGDLVVVRHEEGKNVLTFLCAHGASEPSGADKLMDVIGGSASGLSFQRRVDRAKANLRKPGAVALDYFQIALTTDDQEEMGEILAGLQHDLTAVYGLKRTGLFVSDEEPYMVAVTVRTSQEMIDLVKEKYPEAVITKSTPERKRVS